MRRLTRYAVVLATVAGLGACTSVKEFFTGPPEKSVEELTASEIYERGQAQLAAGSEVAAARTFNEIERLYPFSQFAKRANIMSAYASYEGGQYTDARSAARRYVELYPSDEDAAYAQYIIALTYYDNISDVGRDQNITRNALQELTEVVRRYPNSDYARDAALKIDLTLDHLAGKEMEIGRYYLKRGHYSSAINRFKVVVDEYQTTSQAPEALHRLTEAYLALGLEREAIASAAVLGHNYPGSDWYVASYELLTGRDIVPDNDEADGFFSRVYRQVIQGKWL
ncbi:outer membrane protein assembly factor BamD [Paralimibaculum aggregatum]|nr:outer membrane protein assembly factor BamD [Limibaculum sp. NKW23]